MDSHTTLAHDLWRSAYPLRLLHIGVRYWNEREHQCPDFIRLREMTTALDWILKWDIRVKQPRRRAG